MFNIFLSSVWMENSKIDSFVGVRNSVIRMSYGMRESYFAGHLCTMRIFFWSKLEYKVYHVVFCSDDLVGSQVKVCNSSRFSRPFLRWCTIFFFSNQPLCEKSKNKSVRIGDQTWSMVIKYQLRREIVQRITMQ